MKTRLIPFVSSFVLALAPGVQGAISLGTTAVYDSVNNANAVDATGVGSPLTLAEFTSSVALAHAANLGGVINFDIDGAENPRGGAVTDTELTVTYGASAMNILTVTRPSTSRYQLDMGAADAIAAAPISGTFYLRSSGPMEGAVNSHHHIFNFNTYLDAVGFTILARNGARDGNITVTYNNATQTVLPFSVASVSGTGATSSPDTFFGFEAPSGLSITGVTIAPSGGNFIVIDDFGFIVPEPSSALLGALGTLALLRRRR